MALPVFYVDNIDGNDLIQLNEDTSRHVTQVLRMKPEEQLQLTDGKGNIIIAAIADDHKKKCTVRVASRETRPKGARSVSIAISLLKNTNRFEWFLGKATEIGVTEIIPLVAARSYRQSFRYERMNHILVAAMIQSQQYWLPVLQPPVEFERFISNGAHDTKLIAHCEQAPAQRSIKDFGGSSSYQILIGPEGDFSPREIEMALAQDYQAVSLGETRLRTETAGVVAASLLCIQ